MSSGNFMCALRVSFIVRFFTSLNLPPDKSILHLSAPSTPLLTCFWLKAWAEPPSPQIEAPLRGRAWSISSSQWAKGEQRRGAPANGRPECRKLLQSPLGERASEMPRYAPRDAPSNPEAHHLRADSPQPDEVFALSKGRRV